MATRTPEPLASEAAYSSGLVDLSTLWRHKWWLVATTAAGVLLGFLYVTYADPLSHVGARLLVLRQEPIANQDRVVIDDKDFLATQAEIIRSPAVIEQALGSLPAPDVVAPDYDPLTYTLENLTVDPLAGTKVLSVRFRDEEADRAIQTVQAIIDSYRDYLQRNDQEANRESLRLLRQREKEAREEMVELQEQIRQLRKEGPLLGQGREAGQVQRTLLTELGQALSAARSRRLQLESQLESFTTLLRSDDGTRQVTASQPRVALASANSEASAEAEHDAPAEAERHETLKPPLGIPSLTPHWRDALDALAKLTHEGWLSVEDLKPHQEALLAAQSREAELEQRLGPKHPDLRAVRSQIAALQARLQEAVEGAPAALEREVEVIRQQEESLAALYRQEYETSKHLDEMLLEEERIRGEIAQVQAMHDSVLGQLKQWELVDQQIAEGRPGVLVRVLEGPALTDDGVAPPKLVLAFCGLFGALGGVFLISLQQRARAPQA